MPACASLPSCGHSLKSNLTRSMSLPPRWRNSVTRLEDHPPEGRDYTGSKQRRAFFLNSSRANKGEIMISTQQPEDQNRFKRRSLFRETLLGSMVCYLFGE